MRGVIVPIIALYNYDPTILDGLHVPTLADLDPTIEYVSGFPLLSNADLRDELLARIGEMTPVYNKPDIFKRQVEVWARIHKPEWTKLWQSTIYKYNPIWNKDGTFTETLARSGSNSGSGTDNTTSSGSSNGSSSTSGKVSYGKTDTHSVTGFDTNAFSNDTRDQASGSDTTTGSESRNESRSGTDKRTLSNSGSYKDDQTITRTEQGNIGVTTTQQMLKEEREAAVFNVYDFIIEAFKERFCIMIY